MSWESGKHWESHFIPLLIPLLIPVFTLKPITYRVYDTALNAGMILFNTALGGNKKRAGGWRARLSSVTGLFYQEEVRL